MIQLIQLVCGGALLILVLVQHVMIKRSRDEDEEWWRTRGQRKIRCTCVQGWGFYKDVENVVRCSRCKKPI